MSPGHTDRIVALALSLASFAVYLATSAPSLGSMDAGELAAVAHTLGVAHPTGYPLYSLLGRAVLLLGPDDVSAIRTLNLLSACLTAAAVGIFYRLFQVVLSDGKLFPSRRRPACSADQVPARLAAGAGALVLAFSRTFWSQGVSAEVYALHLVLTGAASLFLLHALEQPASRSRMRLFAYVLGLCFSNHVMTALLIPAYLYLYISVRGAGRAAWTGILHPAPFFFLGLTPYLYLPLRAGLEPVMNWGNPVTPGDFWYHVSGGQYRHALFSSTATVLETLKSIASELPPGFAHVTGLVAAFGLWASLRGTPRAAWFSLLIFAAGVAYAMCYGFRDPEYHLQATGAVALWVAFGVREIALWRSAMRRPVAAVLCGLAALIPLAANFRSVDERGNFAIEDYARDVLEPLDSGAVLLTADGVNLLSALAFLQYAEHVRTDVAVLSFSSLGNPRYYAQLKARHSDIDSVARPLLRDAAGGPNRRADPGELVPWLLWGLSGMRPVYVTPDIEPRYAAGLRASPQGLTMRLSREPLPVPTALPDFFRRPYVKENRSIAAIRDAYATAFLNYGIHLAAAGNVDLGRIAIRRSLAIRPGFPEALEWTRRIGE